MRHLLITLTACAASGPLAYAQTPDTAPPAETLLVTATRLPTAADDLSAGVTVLDRATLAARGDTTLADALTAVPGAQLVQSGGPGANASLFLRGANSNQVQVLIDGIPVNDPSGPGGAFNFGVDSLAGVDRIEVVRGPLSALYGSGAIGGVVNLITAQPTTTPHASVTLAAGLPNALLAQADARGRNGIVDWTLAAESRSDAGSDATPARETVYSGERDGFRSTTGRMELGATPLAGTRIFVSVQGRASVLGFDDVGSPAFDDPNQTGRDNALFARAGVHSTLAGGAWQTTLVVARSSNDRRYVNLLDAADPNQAAEDSRYQSLRTDVQWNNTVALGNLGALHQTTLTAGAEHSDESARQNLQSSYAGFPYIATVDAAERRDAVYLGAQTTLAGRAVLTANAREQAVSGVGDAFTWRAGISVAIPALAAHLKASAGTAFLAPSLYDRYGVDDGGYRGNPALRPERSTGYEIGWSTHLGRDTTLDVTYFDTRLRDLIQSPFVPVDTSVNIDAARTHGVESALQVTLARWFAATASYTYTDARNTHTGTPLLRRPYDTAALTLTLHPLPAWSIVPQILIASGDSDALVDNAGFPAGIGRNRGGSIVNLATAYQLRPDLRAFVWSRNLLGTRYEAASGYATPGASFLAGMQADY